MRFLMVLVKVRPQSKLLKMAPYMIAFSIAIEEAVAPHSSLALMFWGEGLLAVSAR
jgi:hypothetical protein